MPRSRLGNFVLCIEGLLHQGSVPYSLEGRVGEGLNVIQKFVKPCGDPGQMCRGIICLFENLFNHSINNCVNNTCPPGDN